MKPASRHPIVCAFCARTVGPCAVVGCAAQVGHVQGKTSCRECLARLVKVLEVGAVRVMMAAQEVRAAVGLAASSSVVPGPGSPAAGAGGILAGE